MTTKIHRIFTKMTVLIFIQDNKKCIIVHYVVSRIVN